MEGEGLGVVEAGPSEQNCVSLIYKRESTEEEGKEEGRINRKKEKRNRRREEKKQRDT